MRGLCAAVLFLAVSMGVSPRLAHAEGRFALLIGNQAYADKVGPLKNPHKDVAQVGAALEKLGFSVTIIKDAGYKGIEVALKAHITEVRRAGQEAISFVYYSGHGASDPDAQINYVIPVDVDSADETSVWMNSLELGEIVNKLRDQSPNATHYVVFDACREELHLTRAGTKSLGADRGFLAIGSVAGVMIAYATAPGRTASDVGQESGPYARVLSEEILTPGIEAVTMFRNVQLRVSREIGQDPWLSFPTLPAVYFAGKDAKPEGTERQIEVAFWNSVKDRKDPMVVGAYLERYPNGEFASSARELIAGLEQQLRAAEAARRAEMKRQEEAQKASEAQRLEEEQRARAATLAQERQRAEELKVLAELKQNEDRKRAELSASAEELRRASEEARAAREAAKAALKASEEAQSRAKLASLPVALDERRFPESLADDPVALARTLQSELKRVGCYAGDADGTWGAKSQSALEQFVRVSKSDVPTGQLSLAALQAVGVQKERICPLLCDDGEREIDGKCVGKASRAPRKPSGADTPTRSTASGRAGGRRSALPDYRPYEGGRGYGGPGNKYWVGKSLRSTHQE